MENEKKSNGTLVGLLLGIILTLLVFICLFATGTISFNTNKITDNNQTNTENNNEETEKAITDAEAAYVLKQAADKVGNISNGYPYCGDNMTYDDVDAIFDEHNISTHTASKDYKSLNEMKEDLRKYMSDELISKYINDSNYIEKDQKLYCKVYHRGTILYDKNSSTYTTETNNNDKIIAKGIIVTYSEHADEYRKNVNIEMTRNNNNWQITKYEVQE